MAKEPLVSLKGDSLCNINKHKTQTWNTELPHLLQTGLSFPLFFSLSSSLLFQFSLPLFFYFLFSLSNLPLYQSDSLLYLVVPTALFWGPTVYRRASRCREAPWMPPWQHCLATVHKSDHRSACSELCGVVGCGSACLGITTKLMYYFTGAYIFITG